MSIKTKLNLLLARWKYDRGGMIKSALNVAKDGAVVLGEVSSNICETFYPPEDESKPRLSDEAYTKYEIFLGKSKADEVRELVESGYENEKEAEDFINKIVQNYERSKGRRSIEPEKWRDFEDGWRPDNW